jgi:hypothetical protein
MVQIGRLLFASLALVLSVLGASPAAAQMPARFYWKSLSGGNAVPLLVESMNGNSNPFDRASLVTPKAHSTQRLRSAAMPAPSPCSTGRRWARSSCQWAGSRET